MLNTSALAGVVSVFIRFRAHISTASQIQAVMNFWVMIQLPTEMGVRVWMTDFTEVLWQESYGSVCHYVGVYAFFFFLLS